MHCEGEIMMTLNEIGSRAKEVSRVLGTLGSREKNMGLEEAARALLEGEEEILEANSRDYEKARSDGMSQGLLEKQIVQVDCKGKVRTIFLTRQLCRLLKEYAEKRKVQSGPIFVTRSGKPMDRSNIWREMKKIGKKAGINPQKIFPHNLRQ